MDISHIAKNPGHRATAKLMLNTYSFHVLFHVVIAPLLIFLFIRAVCGGKFGEQINKPTTVTVKDPCHLFSLLYDAAFDASTLRLCTDILEAVCMTMRSKALRPISSWQPSPPVTPGSNSMSL